MATFYIATSLSRAKDHNRVRDLLTEQGHTITYDWTLHGSVKSTTVQRLAEVAEKETDGVMSADIVIILLPGGYGTHAELGMALGTGKKIIVHSADQAPFTACEKTCAFYHHHNVSQVVCDINDSAAFLDAIETTACLS